ncbi:hypothetical protein HDU96_005710 [Phlyctochytrium bullatum]|nr:hypothetical protein HDU96_005710 [Phlyctochytrium bullatum]
MSVGQKALLLILGFSDSKLTIPSSSETNAVVTTAKNTGYLGVILAGVAVLGLALSSTATNLLEDYRVNTALTESMSLLSSHDGVARALGTPLEGHGDEPGARGRAARLYRRAFRGDDGRERLVVRFAVKGPADSGVGVVEKVKTDGVWTIHRLFVDIDRRMGRRRIVVVRPPREKAEEEEGKAGPFAWLGLQRLFGKKAAEE